MFYHHNTIRTYTGALLNLFNDLEIQYKNSAGEISSRNIPIRFATKEKSKILDEYSTEQLTSGNYNVLPRANLTWSSIIKSEERTTNKHLKINTKANEKSFDFLYNSVTLLASQYPLGSPTEIILFIANKYWASDSS